MADPDKRNISDQRFVGDAASRYLAGGRRPRTNAQWLDLFRDRYGNAYTVFAPSAFGAQWKAIALFGQRDELTEWSPGELLEELIHHRGRNCGTPEAGK